LDIPSFFLFRLDRLHFASIPGGRGVNILFILLPGLHLPLDQGRALACQRRGLYGFLLLPLFVLRPHHWLFFLFQLDLALHQGRDLAR
jgi:hypothetical protein